MNDRFPPRGQSLANDIRERLNQVRGDLSLRELADGYRGSSESIRRWLLGESCVPADFVAHMCQLTGANPAWILLGIRPMYGHGLADACFQALAEPGVRRNVTNALATLLEFAPLDERADASSNGGQCRASTESMRASEPAEDRTGGTSGSGPANDRAQRLDHRSRTIESNGCDGQALRATPADM